MLEFSMPGSCRESDALYFGVEFQPEIVCPSACQIRFSRLQR
jgi:hypothetical protein